MTSNSDSRGQRRVPMACSFCRKRKIRCEVQTNGLPCRNCIEKGYVCTYVPVEGDPGPQLVDAVPTYPPTAWQAPNPQLASDSQVTSPYTHQAMTSTFVVPANHNAGNPPVPPVIPPLQTGDPYSKSQYVQYVLPSAQHNPYPYPTHNPPHNLVQGGYGMPNTSNQGTSNQITWPTYTQGSPYPTMMSCKCTNGAQCHCQRGGFCPCFN